MKREPRRKHNPVKAESPEAADLASQLAPPEERAEPGTSHGANNSSAINVDTGELKFPKGFIEEGKDDARSFRPDPVIVIIFFLSLAFIAFITYLISIEPSK